MARINVLDRIAAHHWDGLTPSLVGGRFHLTARCESCPETRVWTTRTVFDPKAAVGRANKAGWHTGKHVICPACIAKKKEPKAMSDRSTLKSVWPDAAIAAAPVAPAALSPSEAAKKAKRMVYMALEDYYDDARKSYKPGHSDATIAKELGVAESVVAKIREEDFGPIAEPSELTALREQLKSLEGSAKSVQESMTTALASLEREIATIKKRLDDLCLKNGWRL